MRKGIPSSGRFEASHALCRRDLSATCAAAFFREDGSGTAFCSFMEKELAELKKGLQALADARASADEEIIQVCSGPAPQRTMSVCMCICMCMCICPCVCLGGCACRPSLLIRRHSKKASKPSAEPTAISAHFFGKGKDGPIDENKN